MKYKSRFDTKVKQINMYLLANQAEVAPPLSTILGNEGLRTAKFCEEFNTLTKMLPFYIKIFVNIIVFSEQRSWEVMLGRMKIATWLRLISYSKKKLVLKSGGFHEIIYWVVNLEDIYLISLIIFGSILIKYIKSILATSMSMQLVVKKIVDKNV